MFKEYDTMGAPEGDLKAVDEEEEREAALILQQLVEDEEEEEVRIWGGSWWWGLKMVVWLPNFTITWGFHFF